MTSDKPQHRFSAALKAATILSIFLFSSMAWAHSMTFTVKIVNKTSAAIGVSCNGQSLKIDASSEGEIILKRKESPLEVHCHATLHSHGDETTLKKEFVKQMSDGETATFTVSE